MPTFKNPELEKVTKKLDGNDVPKESKGGNSEGKMTRRQENFFKITRDIGLITSGMWIRMGIVDIRGGYAEEGLIDFALASGLITGIKCFDYLERRGLLARALSESVEEL